MSLLLPSGALNVITILSSNKYILDTIISKKNMYRYINVAKLIPELQGYADEGVIQLAAADIICTFSENNQKTIQALLERPEKVKITPPIAKQFAEVVKQYDGDDVPLHEFTKFFCSKPKMKYKSSVYNNLSSRFDFDISEKELDELTERLLTEYFEGGIV